MAAEGAWILAVVVEVRITPAANGRANTNTKLVEEAGCAIGKTRELDETLSC